MKINIIASKKNGSAFLHETLLEALKESSLEVVESDYDLSIAIGGDGTFLHSIRANDFNTRIAYVGINNGKLGFLQNVETKSLIPFVKALENKEFHLDKIHYEKILVHTENQTYEFKALNEVVIRDEGLKTTYLDIAINNENIERIVGDGVLVSTPVGSTAYNMSIGGPIVYTDINCLVLTPVSPINNIAFNTIRNPIVFQNKVLKITPVDRTSDLIIVVDGVVNNINEVKSVEVSLSDETLKFLRLNDYKYENIIKNKFNN